MTSQLFANIYLNELDQFVKHRLKVKAYARYTDDFVILHHDRAYLENLLPQLSHFLATKLKLSLHPHKIEIRKFSQGIDFLGYTILPHAILVRTKTRRRLVRKLRTKVKQYKQGQITETALFGSINSYLGILEHANAYKLKRELKHRLWEWFNTET